MKNKLAGLFRAKILILSAVFLLAAFTFAGMAEARIFMVYNNSDSSKTYFIVNGTTGYAGAGLMNPAYPLDVSGAGRFSGNLYLGTAGRYVYDTGSVIGVSSGLLLGGNLDLGGNNLTNYNYLVANDSAKLNGQLSSYYLDTSSTAQTKSGSLTVTGAWLNATNLNVSSNAYFGGNVGIGTSAPDTALVVSNSATPYIFIENPSITGSQILQVTAGTAAGNVALVANYRTGTPTIGMQFLTRNAGAAVTGMQITGAGNVGIGTANPQNKLNVIGDINATGSVYSNGASLGGIPSGMIAFFASSSCPSGWTEYTALRGRALVGLVSSGTVAGTVGTALTDLEDRTHTHTGPSHTHTYTDVPAHTHSIDPPATATDSQGSHSHTVTPGTGSGGLPYPPPKANYGGAGTQYSTDAAGAHTHTVDIAPFTSGSTGVATGTTAASGTGSTGTAATSNVIPYIQLLACQKT